MKFRTGNRRRQRKSNLEMLLILLVLAPAVFAQVPNCGGFDASSDTVWQATIETIAAEHFEVQNSDKASGVIWLKETRSFGKYNGSYNNVINKYTAKHASGFSTWDGLSVSGSLTVNGPDGKVKVECHFQLSGHSGGGLSPGWKTLESNGYLEGRVLAGITKRFEVIGRAKPATDQAAAFNPDKVELLRLADAALGKLRKVNAGFKMDASTESITSSLIDAQAQLDELSAYKSAMDSSKLMSQLGNAIEGFKKARTLSGQEKNDALEQSRVALANASDAIQAMK
jgi:hypothetical protein